MKRFLLALVVTLAFCGAAFAEAGYVRLAINGTNVNLRPQPRAGGSVVAQMNTGDVFFAEKWPITCGIDDSLWYKIVLPAPDSGAIKPLRDWDSRFRANVAFVNANFATVSPLKNGDIERIANTPVGQGYSFNQNEHAFADMVKVGILPFNANYSIKNATDIYDSPPINDNDPAVIGRYEQGADIRTIGVDSVECLAYVVADPSFRKPVGWVDADDVSVHRYEMDFGDFDFLGFQRSCVLSLGANLPEIIRKWGDATIERSAFEFLDEYVIYTSVEGPDYMAAFYEMPPMPDRASTDILAITYLSTFSIERKGAIIGGIHIGNHDKNTVKKLLGEPDTTGLDGLVEEWNWTSEFNDLYVYFDKDGRVSSMYIQARSAD